MMWQPSKSQLKIIECMLDGMSPKKNSRYTIY